MALSFLYNDADTVTVPTTLPFVGLYIPIADLPGMTAAELATTEAANRKEGKTVFSLIQRIHSYLFVNTGTLSLTTSISNPTVVSPSLISVMYNLQVNYLTNVALGTNSMIPPASTGVYSGIGDISLRDIFPNCIKVTSTANTADASGIGAAGAGVLISSGDLATYGFLNDVPGSTISTLNITGDNRYAIAALYQSICDGNVGIRSTANASGITKVNISNAVVFSIPASYYSASNPVSGISSANLDHLSITARTYSITFELVLLMEVLEINNVTADA
jgi:hypothetical protein